MGMAEGVMRDQVLARRRGEFTAEYGDEEFKAVYAACLRGVTVTLNATKTRKATRKR
jgi:hypothetical protein